MKKLIVLILISVSFTLTIYSQEKQDTIKSQNQPKAIYQIGKAKVTVWETQMQGKYGEFTAIDFKVEKIYKKGDKWKSTDTFNLTELLQLRAAIDKAISEEGVKIKEVNDNDEK
jgi:hypothetical protein